MAPPAVAPHTIAEAPRTGSDVFLHVLIAITAVIMTGLILAKALAYLGQPPVIGEVIAGIVLGPSFLGADASALLLPYTVAPFLGVIAQLGVLMMALVTTLATAPVLEVLMPSTVAEDASGRASSCHG
jgi:Kef-type K+ transport system membrane component KefB